MRNLVARVLTISGIFLIILSGFLYWQRVTPQRLSFSLGTSEFAERSENESSVLPTKIVIPDLSIDLPIYQSRIEKGKWQATTKGVSYLASSPIPGETGNSILYGHNWKSLLGDLTRAKPGQTIEIIFSDGSVKNFVVSYTQIVNPNQTQILDQTSDRRITLYTCTGFLDRQRFVVTAVLSEDPDETS